MRWWLVLQFVIVLVVAPGCGLGGAAPPPDGQLAIENLAKWYQLYRADNTGATPANSLDPARPSHEPWYWQGVTHGKVVRGKKYYGVIARTIASPAYRDKDIIDGHSNTMMVSEKRVYINRYKIGDWHDDIGWTDGWDPDIMRYTGYPPAPDINQGAPNDPGGVIDYHFGAAHSSAINAVFADGHVTQIAYVVDLVTFNAMGDRRDGQAITIE